MDDLLVPPEHEYLFGLEPSVNLTRVEGLVLCKLASISQGAIVEIGSYKGKSACFLAAGAKMGTKQPITCVEPWEECDPKYDNRASKYMERFAKESIRHIFNRQTRPYKKQITAIQGYSAQVAKSWKKPVGLVFIDGNHHEATRDFLLWYPHVIENGMMAFHDVRFGYVKPQIKEIQEMGLLEHWVIFNRMMVATKKKCIPTGDES